MKRKVLVVVGLLFMPFFWVVINCLILLDRDEKFVTLTFLYKDFWQHFVSNKPFGAFDQ